jgi:hypothetical protein
VMRPREGERVSSLAPVVESEQKGGDANLDESPPPD